MEDRQTGGSNKPKCEHKKDERSDSPGGWFQPAFYSQAAFGQSIMTMERRIYAISHGGVKDGPADLSETMSQELVHFKSHLLYQNHDSLKIPMVMVFSRGMA